MPELLLRCLPALFFAQFIWSALTRPPVETILWTLITMVAIVAVEVRRFRITVTSAALSANTVAMEIRRLRVAHSPDPDPDADLDWDPDQSTDRSTDVPR